nr:branched-chain amino acid ABC transporter permease [Ensifer sp. ENS04]
MIQQIANAVPLAALYAALAFGYALSLAVTKRADLTYGALFAFSGQMFVLFADVGWNSLWLTLPASLAFGIGLALTSTALAGLVGGGFVMKPLAFVSANSVIVASLGSLMVLMETASLSSGFRSLWLPHVFDETVMIWPDPLFPVALTAIQLVNTAVIVLVIIVGYGVLDRSRYGRYWRAVSDDREAAALCGVNPERVYVAAYVAASLIAALCGILAALHYGNMDFGMGLAFGVKVLFIAAIGGQMKPLFAALGAAGFGFVETMWSAYGPIIWRDFAVFGILVLILVLTRRDKSVP